MAGADDTDPDPSDLDQTRKDAAPPSRDPTLFPRDLAESQPRQVVAGAGELGDGTREDRYRNESVLGRGGMGEVRLCLDQHIGRQVAMKLIRAGHGSLEDARARFLREARVQGQLEHPAVVPVYDLGRRSDGQVFFTMKRVRGESLAEVLERLRAGKGEPISLRRILTAFSQVCLAVDFAHERGVLHRDLKPANIMLGDYGEVYVLDWGLAKIGGAPDPSLSPSMPPIDNSATAVGEVLGTPGYIAPEQLEGEPSSRSDVYALGAILFELLTLERLHQGKTAQMLMVSTMEGVDARASERAPDREIPPELDRICERATVTHQDGRFASARELHEAIEAFLDGDRDLQLRRELAVRHADAANEAAEAALAGDADARTASLRELGRALALDPQNPGAMSTLVRLLSEPPRELPKEAEEAFEASSDAHIRTGARNGAIGYATFVFYLPMLFWMGIRDGSAVTLTTTLVLIAAFLSYLQTRTDDNQRVFQYVIIAIATVGLASLTRLFGPYVLLPTVMTGQVVSFALTHRRIDRILFTAMGCIGVGVPALLEWSGMIPPSYAFIGGEMHLLPGMTELPPIPTRLVLLAVSVALVITPVVLVGRSRDALSKAERRLHLHAWHFRQLGGGQLPP